MLDAPRDVNAWQYHKNYFFVKNQFSGTKTWGFPRSCRIVKASEFSSILSLRPVCKTEHFTLYTCLNEVRHPRLGIVTAKRIAPRAITRNTIKRIVREFFRMMPLSSIDYIVRLSRSVHTKTGSAKNAFLKQELHCELKKILIYLPRDV